MVCLISFRFTLRYSRMKLKITLPVILYIYITSNYYVPGTVWVTELKQWRKQRSCVNGTSDSHLYWASFPMGWHPSPLGIYIVNENYNFLACIAIEDFPEVTCLPFIKELYSQNKVAVYLILPLIISSVSYSLPGFKIIFICEKHRQVLTLYF